MSRAKILAIFVGVSLPSLFMLLWSADSLLLVAEDVFLVSLLQVAFIGVFIFYGFRQASN